MSEDGFSDSFDEPNMEIQIDTLMGTSFDMRVSSTDTIREIKQRIQRVEGIPIHQQNLIFQSKELKDSRRLCDAGIKNGSIIKLVLAMKGGPISTRRLSLSCEHHMMIKELKELLENTRDEIGDKLVPGSKVSVLVFKEGDILNLLRVIENEDGSYSPYNDKQAISPPTRPNRRDTQIAMFEKFVEDTDMMTKISNLRKRMEDVHLKKQQRSTKIGDTTEKDKPNLTYKLLSECSHDLLDNVDLKIFESDEDSPSEAEEVALKDKHRIRKQNTKSLYSETKGAYSHTKQHYARIHKAAEAGTTATAPKDNGLCLPLAVPLTRLVSRPKSATSEGLELEEQSDLWEIHESGSDRLKHSATCKFGVLKRRQSSVDCGYESIETTPPPPQQKQEIVCGEEYFHLPQFMASPSAVPPQYAPKDPDFCNYYFRNNRSPLYGRRGDAERVIKKEERGQSIYDYFNFSSTTATPTSNNNEIGSGCKKKEVELAPVVLKKKSRCNECNKRLNITNIYNCRCGKIFCSQHRYSEVHRCNYDYKSEGRRILEHQNPLITAEKIHRI